MTTLQESTVDVPDGPGGLDYAATAASVMDGLFGTTSAPKIDRFVVVRTIGSGAMGRVYLAYDPELDRKVAIKVIHVTAGEIAPRRRTRLIREARALARVAHPNVVTVFEVGTVSGDVFVAMEFVEGQSLRQWLQRDRPWPERLRVLLQAGEGLAAAHDAGLVHRDFKPDNVLVGDDGRVRVVDFGLARAAGNPESAAADSPAAAADMSDLATPLTRTGAVLGTPAYMAPEQLATADVDARCDQFSFCVTVFEAMHGTRPFAGSTAFELAEHALDGSFVTTTRSFPPRVEAAVARGLSGNPDERWPTMRALLHALAHDPRAARRRLAAYGLVAAGVGFGVWGIGQTSASNAPCSTAADELATVWGDAQAAAVRQAFQATGARFASTAADEVVAELDHYAERWAQGHTTACEATNVAKTQSPELLDRRMLCLQRRRSDLAAVVGVLTEADLDVVMRSTDLVDGLGAVSTCADVDALLAAVPPPADAATRGAVAAVRDALAKSKALHQAGHYADADAVARAQLVAAADTGYPLVRAEVLGRLAATAASAGRPKYAVEHATEAFLAAVAAGDDRLALVAATRLVGSHGWALQDLDAARRWHDHAKALLQRLGHPAVPAAQLDEALGRAYVAAGEPAKAAELMRAAVAVFDAHPDAQGLDRAGTRQNLALALVDLDQIDAAREALDQALAEVTERLGSEHPRTATSHNAIGMTLAVAGALDEARGHFERALAIYEVAAPDSTGHATVLGNLGNTAAATGDHAGARAYYERALAVFEGALGPEHPRVAATLGNLSVALTGLGDLEGSRRLLQRALSIRRAHSGPDHVGVARLLSNLAGLERRLGRYDDAVDHFERSIEIHETKLGPDHSKLAFPLTGLGEVRVAQGRASEAVPLLRRALSIRTVENSSALERAETELALGQALVLSTTTRNEGVTMLHRARATFAAEDGPRRVTEVDDVLGDLQGK